MKTTIRDVIARFERYFELIYAEVVATKNEVAQLNSRMSAVEGGMSGLEAGQAQLNSRMSNVERGLGDVRADNRAIRSDLNALRRERTQ